MSATRRQQLAAATPILIFHKRRCRDPGARLAGFSPGQALVPDTCTAAACASLLPSVGWGARRSGRTPPVWEKTLGG